MNSDSLNRQGFPRFSLIVATVDRRDPLERLLNSLDRQAFRSFEVLVIDQNAGDFLAGMLLPPRFGFPLQQMRTAVRGASRARNVGGKQARGALLLFPDDDCWYPPDYLARMNAIFGAGAVDLVTGRPTDETGRTINGRFEAVAGPISRARVFTTQIEWNMALTRSLFDRLGGFDEGISLGGPTPWQAAEGFDLVLRAIAAGARCDYDPDLVAHHEELPVAKPDRAMIAKGRLYARGFGYVLRKNGFGLQSILWWVGRSLGNALIGLICGRPDRVRYFAGLAIGRWEGWSGRSLIGTPFESSPAQDVSPTDTLEPGC